MQIPAIKHYKMQYMLMRQKLGNGGEKVVGNLEGRHGGRTFLRLVSTAAW